MQIRKINAKDATGPAGGGYSQATTIVVDIFDSKWLVEIEAIAAA
jgi:hypothetical protein